MKYSIGDNIKTITGKILTIEIIRGIFYYVSDGSAITDEMIEGLVEEEDRKIMHPNDWNASCMTAKEIYVKNKYHEDLMRISERAMAALISNSEAIKIFAKLDQGSDVAVKSICIQSIQFAKTLLAQLKLEQK